MFYLDVFIHTNIKCSIILTLITLISYSLVNWSISVILVIHENSFENMPPLNSADSPAVVPADSPAGTCGYKMGKSSPILKI